jgi:hypothetical protein
LFKYLFKIVGIPACYATTVDDNAGIEKVRRGLQFEKINDKYKAVRLFRNIVIFLYLEGFQGFL